MKKYPFVLAFGLLAGSRCPAAPAAKVAFKITGTAVSTRDHSPVPYCRMQITESANTALQGSRPNENLRGSQRAAPPTEVEADVQGHFQFNLEHAGAYVVTGSARDYRRQNFDEHETILFKHCPDRSRSRSQHYFSYGA